MLVKEWAEREHLHPQTVWKWCREGTMPVPVEQTPTGMWLIHDPKYETTPQWKSMEHRTVCYARVSSGDQKNDLQRQADRLKGKNGSEKEEASDQKGNSRKEEEARTTVREHGESVERHQRSIRPGRVRLYRRMGAAGRSHMAQLPVH